jgi:hypothetical protein
VEISGDCQGHLSQRELQARKDGLSLRGALMAYAKVEECHRRFEENILIVIKIRV